MFLGLYYMELSEYGINSKSGKKLPKLRPDSQASRKLERSLTSSFWRWFIELTTYLESVVQLISISQNILNHICGRTSHTVLHIFRRFLLSGGPISSHFKRKKQEKFTNYYNIVCLCTSRMA